MYNTEYTCTYQLSLDSYQGNDKEKEYVIDMLYKVDLLSVLNLDEFNDTKVNERITELYYKVEHNEELKKCMSKLACDYMSDDNIFGLMLLLSFDYLNYTHICISELLKTNNISEKNLKILKDMIN
jgi:gamma-glutamylcyclotransferase (GGCT)/AIG2-like uncharacterized protein YtfP